MHLCLFLKNIETGVFTVLQEVYASKFKRLSSKQKNKVTNRLQADPEGM